MSNRFFRRTVDVPKAVATGNQSWLVEWGGGDGPKTKADPIFEITDENLSTKAFFSMTAEVKSGKRTHHVNHMLKLFLADKMVVDAFLLAIVGPPCGVAGSAAANTSVNMITPTWRGRVNSQIGILDTDPEAKYSPRS